MKTGTRIGAVALALAVGTTVAVGQVSTFIVLPPAPGDNYLNPRGISGDGTTVFGDTGVLLSGNLEAYRWTAALGGQNIGALVSGPFSQSLASSANGASVFGRDNGSGGFVWTAPGAVAATDGGPAVDVSADGAVRLTQTQRIGASVTSVAPLPGDQNSLCESISADGSAVALTSHFFQSGGSGYGYGGGGPDIVRDQACIWTESGGTVGCGFLPGTDRSFAACISEDGAVVLGVSRAGNSGPPRGFRWTPTGGINEMLPIAGQASPTSVEPVDSSADGSVVVCEVDGEACVWTEAGGFRSIKQILLANGWDVGAWTFYSVAGISDDGLVVTGSALDANGGLAAFVTPLQSTCSGPAVPWSASRRVVVAQGDALPGGGAAESVQAVTVSAAGAALVRCGADLWLSPTDGGALSPVAFANSGGFMGIDGAGMSENGVLALSRLSTITVPGPLGPETEVVRTLQVGPLGGLVTVAAHGGAAPAVSGGGTLVTYGTFNGPFVNGSGLTAFQCLISGGTQGSVHAFVYDGVSPNGLTRIVPGVSLTSPLTLALSDSGVALRRAAEGLLAGGPPPAVTALIAPVGGAAPGITGGTFASFPDAAINGGGTVAFKAAVNTPNGSVDAVYRKGSTGTLTLLAATGTQLGDGQTLLDVQDVLIAENGSVYFTGRAEVTGAGVVVKVRPDGSLLVVAREGDLLPGSGPCRQMSGFQLQGIDGRRVLIQAGMSGPSSVGQALLAWGEGEPLSVLARTGAVETLRPGLGGTVSAILVSSQGGSGRDGRNSNFKGGRAVYGLVLTDPQGAPRSVVVEETLPALPCGQADLGVQGGLHGSDGVLDNNDFIAFIDLFFSNDLRADFGSQGGVPGANGVLDNNDFIVFIDRFFGGCV